MDNNSSVFAELLLGNFASYILSGPPMVKAASGRLRMVDAVSLRVHSRRQVRMAFLKSGFRNAYISGFTNELVAMVKKEIMDSAYGMMLGLLKMMSAVVM